MTTTTTTPRAAMRGESIPAGTPLFDYGASVNNTFLNTIDLPVQNLKDVWRFVWGQEHVTKEFREKQGDDQVIIEPWGTSEHPEYDLECYQSSHQNLTTIPIPGLPRHVFLCSHVSAKLPSTQTPNKLIIVETLSIVGRVPFSKHFRLQIRWECEEVTRTGDNAPIVRCNFFITALFLRSTVLQRLILGHARMITNKKLELWRDIAMSFIEKNYQAMVKDDEKTAPSQFYSTNPKTTEAVRNKETQNEPGVIPNRCTKVTTNSNDVHAMPKPFVLAKATSLLNGSWCDDNHETETVCCQNFM